MPLILDEIKFCKSVVKPSCAVFNLGQDRFKQEMVPESVKYKNDYFACKIVGESMNRVIPNGSICLFKPDSGGSRNGKIVLVENIDFQDPDFNSSFTIKTLALMASTTFLCSLSKIQLS